MIRIRMTAAPEKLATSKYLLFALLAVEALALFLIRLPGTLQFNNFAFFDAGANLTVQYLIDRGFRPTIDFAYPYGLLTLLIGRVWFRILGLTPIACVAAIPLIDILIVWGLVRFATNIKLNLAGVLLFALTALLTIPSAFLNLTHGIEPVFLLHALADQSGGNRRRALVFAVVTFFVKPSMAYFLCLVLLSFIAIECIRDRSRSLRTIVAEIRPAILVGLGIAALLIASFGPIPVIRSVIPTAGLAVYRAQGFGFFNGAGRLFLSPQNAPWSYYFANIAGPWIVYTAVLVTAALVVLSRVLERGCDVSRTDRTPELIITCAVLHLSFLLLFFGNQLSWIYYFYILVLGLAATARLGPKWEVLVVCLAFAVPLTKVYRGVAQRVSPGTQEARKDTEGHAATSPTSSSVPDESGFTYQLWYTTAPSPETAGLWATPSERAEWIKVLAMIRGQRASMIEYAGCADLLFPQFNPPVTLFLMRGGSAANELSQKLSQLRASSMVVLPRWHGSVLDQVPEIGALMRHDFIPAFQGTWFIVYVRRNT
jgi:hypothetical protein